MNIITIILLIIIILCSGYGISIFFKDSIFNIIKNNKYTIFKKYHNIFNFIALLIAFTGCIIWFIGEYLVVLGHNNDPIIDAVGAAACSIAAFITLIIFLEKK
ncbi:hypothetical protein ceV_068 [Chrysochromulina ericina virus CeV-01B]|uniref:Uncharacterized protein n=1 Tax=Chrysochromulina ericina virus CeV-01B TaxID=3070830 RepID=A0A0N9R3A4_9VIRU|nr:hypothetical protein ceV_068 [Chrysochromulina ericina virus]ALH22974.1 hypothetical protein ceV_068 [Chrysochromulina ericina virus CeV-01B]|tara:strand:+ start:474 stop:782 length:309 start_codon:yes stop_codon:yes gene_type:complete